MGNRRCSSDSGPFAWSDRSGSGGSGHRCLETASRSEGVTEGVRHDVGDESGRDTAVPRGVDEWVQTDDVEANDVRPAGDDLHAFPELLQRETARLRKD